MNKYLIILLVENLLLALILTIWSFRKCTKCKKVKCIERILAAKCKECSQGKSDSWQTKVF